MVLGEWFTVVISLDYPTGPDLSPRIADLELFERLVLQPFDDSWRCTMLLRMPGGAGPRGPGLVGR